MLPILVLSDIQTLGIITPEDVIKYTHQFNPQVDMCCAHNRAAANSTTLQLDFFLPFLFAKGRGKCFLSLNPAPLFSKWSVTPVPL